MKTIIEKLKIKWFIINCNNSTIFFNNGYFIFIKTSRY